MTNDTHSNHGDKHSTYETTDVRPPKYFDVKSLLSEDVPIIDMKEATLR